MPTNKQRISRCRKAVIGYSGNKDLVASLVDFLADAMHLCRAKSLAFDGILARAARHFEAERTDKPIAAPTAFDVYEIHGVREYGKGKNRYCEQVPDEDAQFFSLYGHIPGQGLDGIGDFKTREHAEEVYALITGKHYHVTTAKEA